MKILVTGAKGFVGRNLVASLKCIRDGKDRCHKIDGLSDPSILDIVEYDVDNSVEDLEKACADCDFVFNLAGVNRTKKASEFMDGNFGFASLLLETLKKYNNVCPVMLSSSVQATLKGRFGESEYGKSKLAGEELFFEYGRETGSKVLVYRFPNLFGKWCRPNYNSAVATFCNNIANDLPIQINDRSTELELVYIDDLIEEMMLALNGDEHRCEFEEIRAVEKLDGKYCFVPMIHKATLGEIVDCLKRFNAQPKTLELPEILPGSFEKKLYTTFLSYLPETKIKFSLDMKCDNRGSFTEILKTANCGQFSVNVSNPGITKGEHWHHSKWEFFIVVSGKGLIRERRIDSDEIVEFEVDGNKIEMVHMLPGYAHSIVNLSDTEPLITLMWANEHFDQEHPDTFHEKV